MASSSKFRSGISLINKFGYLCSDSLPAQRSTLHRAVNGFGLTHNLEEDISKGSRNYSTSAVRKQEKVKVPLALFGGSGNYASALYITAVKANALDKVGAELVELVEATKKSPTFSQFTKDLSVPADVRVKALDAISTEAKFSEITKKFLAVVADNGRLRYLDSIAKKFTDLTMAHKGEVKAIVTTVVPLPPAEEKELIETLQDIVGQGKKIKVEQKIDTSILGGLVIEFSQKVFDLSIRSRAQQLERLLREPINISNL